MRALILIPDRDSEGKRDWSHAFRPEAEAFAEEHGIEAAAIHRIDISRPPLRRRRQVLDILAATVRPLEAVAFFCHGFRSGMQLGFASASAAELAGAIHAVSGEDVFVPLYACSTADGTAATTGGPGGDGGFADTLRDALCRAGATGCRVDAHATVGHATRNPHVRRFAGEGSPVGGNGGSWIVRPRSELWRTWIAALKGDLRLRFPLMEVADIHRELAG